MKVNIDNQVYASQKAALKEMRMAMMCCDGSEAERMTYAYCMVAEGYTAIDTYRERVGQYVEPNCIWE